MHNTGSRCKSCFLVAFTLILLATGCGGPEYLNSARRARDVTVDGVTDESEWGGGRFWFGGIKGTLGIMNDEDYLYISVATSDSVLRTQIVRGGLTLWFNAAGNEDQTVGIEFPMPMMAQAPVQGAAASPEEAPALTPDVAECTILTNPGEVRETVAVTALAAQGIELAVTVEGQRIVYEAKIPLRQTAAHPHAVNITDKRVVGIGFVTGTAGQQRGGRGAAGGGGARGGGSAGGGMPAGGGGGARGGAAGGAGGGARGGAGGGAAGAMAQAAAPLNLWIAAMVSP